MKTSMLIPAIVACALWVPIVSAQDKHAHDKSATSTGSDKQMGEMLATMNAQNSNRDNPSH